MADTAAAAPAAQQEGQTSVSRNHRLVSFKMVANAPTIALSLNRAERGHVPPHPGWHEVLHEHWSQGTLPLRPT